MSLLACEVTDGPRPGFKDVGVASIQGHREFLTIEERFLVSRNGAYSLPVRLIARDRSHNTALIQLPVEADSGANRVWVSSTSLSETPDEVVT